MTAPAGHRMEDLVLVPMTDAQWTKSHEYQYTFWGSGLSLPQFEERERRFCLESEFARQGNYKRWVLVPKNDQETLDFCCSCETWRRPIYMTSSDGSTCKEDFCYSIASVFTPEHQRKKNYASRMMSLLHTILADELHAPLSMLYSDVGNFYSRAKREHASQHKRCGWEITGNQAVVWKLEDPELHSWIAAKSEDGREIKEIREEDFASICEIDALLLKREADEEAKAGGHGAANKTVFVELPTASQWSWEIIRAKYLDSVGLISSRVERGLRVPGYWGFQIGRPPTKGDEVATSSPSSSSSSSEWALILFSFDLPNANIDILRIRCSSPSTFHQLFARVVDLARQQDVKSINAWNVDPALLEGTKWRNETTKEHLPALAWYGEEEQEKVVWFKNEHWAWC